MDGLLIIDKPEGPTSHDVVARLRRLLHESRIGHTGTLDPMATGVLPLVLGRATRLAQFLTSDSKRYEAVVQLGQATDTYDRLGEPTSESAVTATRESIEAALDRFRGDITQAPPPYSAKKIGGVSAHRLARRGQAVAPAPVQVATHRLDLVAVDLTTHRATLDITCSAGFYVRSLAHDLGQTLGCGAHLAALRRTASGEWTLADAVPLAACERDPATAREQVIPMTRLLTAWPAVVVTEEGERRVRHGQLLRTEDFEAPLEGSVERSFEGSLERSVERSFEGSLEGSDDVALPPMPLPTRSWSYTGEAEGGRGGEGEGALPPRVRVRLLSQSGSLLGIAEQRPDGSLHPGLVLV